MLFLAALLMTGGSVVGASCIVDGSLDRGPSDEAMSAARSDVEVFSGTRSEWTFAVLDARDVFTIFSVGRNLDCRPPSGFYILFR